MEIRVKMRFIPALSLMPVCVLAGCVSGPSGPGVKPMANPVLHPSRFGSSVSLTNPAGSNTRIPAPVFKVVHHAVATPATLTYFAMVSPWPVDSMGVGRPFAVRMQSLRTQWSAVWGLEGLPRLPRPATGIGFSTVHEGFAAGAADYDAVATTTSDACGWVYFTGDKPICQTKRVIGGADGTTFVCEVASQGGMEYHRFALLFPNGAPTTSTVHLTSLDATPLDHTLTAAEPFAVYSCTTGGTGGAWTGGSSIGSGSLWGDFQEALDNALDNARYAGLPSIP